MNDLNKRFIDWVFICGALFLMGCSEPEQGTDSSFLIKTASIMITSVEFLEELDLKRAAYPYDIDENPEGYNKMVMDLVQMLSNEILLLSAASDKGVDVTMQEVQSAEEELRKDYLRTSKEQDLMEKL